MSHAILSIHAACTAQTTIATPLGTLLLARTAHGLAGAWFEAQKHHPGALAAPESPHDALLRDAAAQLADYFAGRTTSFDVPLDLRGTDFQRGVWQALQFALPKKRSSPWLSLSVALLRSSRPRIFSFGAGGKSRISWNSDIK